MNLNLPFPLCYFVLTCHSIILKYIKNISNKLAINGKLSNFENDSDLSLVNCTSWGNTDNTITKIGNRVFITFGMKLTVEQSSGSLIIGRIARTYYPKTAYVRANAAGGTNGDNHILYIDKSNGTVILNPSTERYYSASFSYLAD